MNLSLNKINPPFLWGICFISLFSNALSAQPVQLTPKKEATAQQSSPLVTPQDTKGFWDGTPPSVIESYFSKLPLRLTSSALQTMRAEILKEKYPPLLQDIAYEKMLFTLLMGTGQLQQANDFLLESNLPEQEDLLIDLLWLQGNSKLACEKITNLLRTSSKLEWKKQNIYCLYLNGEEERGKIAAELLSETTPDVSPLINSLFDPSSQPLFDSTIAQSPFLLTIWCTIGQDIPENDLTKLSPASLKLVAQAEKMPLKTRLFAAQLALEEGNFKADDLLLLLRNAPSDSLLAKFDHERLSLKVENILPLFEKASQESKLRLVANVFKPLLSKINPSAETLPLAPYMIRVFLSIGANDLAKKWGTFFMREAPEEAIALLPLLHIAFPETTWGDSQLEAWQAYQTREYPDQAPQKSYTLRRILEALGESPGSAMKGEPAAPSWLQDKGMDQEQDITLLDSGANSKRTGEVILLILGIIQEIPLKDLVYDKFPHLILALNKAGRSAEAHSLALEFLLEKGL